MYPRLPVIASLLILFPVAAAGADAARLNFATIEAGEVEADGGFTVLVGDDAVAVARPVDADQASVLFRREGDEVVFIDHDRGEYTVITEAWLDEATTRAREAARATQERLEALGESEAAAALLRMMPLMDATDASQSKSAAQYRPRGQDSDYNGVSCRQFDEIVDGRLQRVVCLADASGIGLSAQRSALLERFLATVARLQSAGLEELGFTPPPLALSGDKFDGVPILATDTKSNGYLLAGPAKDTADTDMLRVPERFLEAKIPLYGF